MRAWTIGSERSYDEALDKSRENGVPVTKIGKGGDPDDPDYEGGWVWNDLEAAKVAAYEATVQIGHPFAVYELNTGDKTWDELAFRGKDGEHHLLADATLIGKAEA